MAEVLLELGVTRRFLKIVLFKKKKKKKLAMGNFSTVMTQPVTKNPSTPQGSELGVPKFHMFYCGLPIDW